MQNVMNYISHVNKMKHNFTHFGQQYGNHNLLKYPKTYRMYHCFMTQLYTWENHSFDFGTIKMVIILQQ